MRTGNAKFDATHIPMYGKQTHLPLFIADWPIPWRESYEERAAIMQYDGGLSKDSAEFQAENLCRQEFAKQSRAQREMF